MRSTHKDSRGTLEVVDLRREVPFEVKRIFTVSGVPQGVRRGNHAHKACHQFLVAVKGSVKCSVSGPIRKDEFSLDEASPFLYIPPMHWGVQYDFSEDSLLLVLASHSYDPEDYINDWDEFVSAATPR